MDNPAGYSSLRRPGDLKHSLLTADHDGWLICDGRTIQRSSYPRFFASLGLTAALWKLPTAADLLLLGAGGRLAVGAVGGSNEVVLTVENLPEHAHGYDDTSVEATAKTGALTGVLPIITAAKATTAPKTTGKAGGGKAVKLEPKALGANVFVYAGRAV